MNMEADARATALRVAEGRCQDCFLRPLPLIPRLHAVLERQKGVLCAIGPILGDLGKLLSHGPSRRIGTRLKPKRSCISHFTTRPSPIRHNHKT